MSAEPDAVSPPTFDDLPLSPEVRRAVDDLGYVHPTPVQRAVFEPATRGRDLVVQARTGTGKTAAFGLPLIDGLVRRKDPVIQAVVLCPTRELALQVTRELEALGKHRGTRIVAVYGGAPMPRQIAQIREGAQILVGTPGRTLDHLGRGTLDPRHVRTVVLDESDEMLSMGFLPQITEIFSYLPAQRQTLLFSATLPPDIRRMAETRLTSPEFITLSGDNIGALEIRHFVYLSRGDKLAELVQVIEVENPESAIIFCNTRDETKRVAGALNQQGYAADWLNADLPQNDREKVMAATRQGKLRFLVATDVAARGIDISHLTHVMNFDLPESAESYVHRTGRTGRAGKTGTAISLIEPHDIGNLYLLRLTYKLKPIERQLPSATEIKTRAETDLVRWFVEGAAARTAPHARASGDRGRESAPRSPRSSPGCARRRDRGPTRAAAAPGEREQRTACPRERRRRTRRHRAETPG
jgi:ATP-dependent RNA helicase DeaD